jgi:hypothetical protein
MTVNPNHEPDVADETQEEPAEVSPHPPVLVTIDGPVRVQQLPGVRTIFTRVVASGDQTPVVLVNPDLRRREVKFLSDQPILISDDQQAVIGNSAPIWPANLLLPIPGSGKIYVKSNTPGTAATIIVVDILWTN